MSDQPSGSIYTAGSSGGRIVGPSDQAEALAASLNDPELHIAFSDVVSGEDSRIYSREMMGRIGVNHPVLVLPLAARAKWENDPEAQPGGKVAHVKPYTGPLPEAERRTSFGIVRPGSRS